MSASANGSSTSPCDRSEFPWEAPWTPGRSCRRRPEVAARRRDRAGSDAIHATTDRNCEVAVAKVPARRSPYRRASEERKTCAPAHRWNTSNDALGAAARAKYSWRARASSAESRCAARGARTAQERWRRQRMLAGEAPQPFEADDAARRASPSDARELIADSATPIGRYACSAGRCVRSSSPASDPYATRRPAPPSAHSRAERHPLGAPTRRNAAMTRPGARRRSRPPPSPPRQEPPRKNRRAPLCQRDQRVHQKSSGHPRQRVAQQPRGGNDAAPSATSPPPAIARHLCDGELTNSGLAVITECAHRHRDGAGCVRPRPRDGRGRSPRRARPPARTRPY